MTTHRPDPASYDCTAPGCGQPWPCPPERERLRACYSPARLGLLLGPDFEAALRVLQAPRHAVHARFLGWIRQPRPPMKGQDHHGKPRSRA